METDVSLFIALVFAILGFHWNKKHSAAKPAQKKRKAAAKASLNRITNPFRCVEIEPCLGACEAVKPYKHIKILLDKAPALPLRGCDNNQCVCKFIRHDDRRIDERRARSNSARQTIDDMQAAANNQNQRAWPDRRKAQI